MIAFPKRSHIRSRKLLDSARGESCVACGAQDMTVVAAHSNDYRDGKSFGMKAEDIYIAHLCLRCHQWYDGEYARSGTRRAEAQSWFDVMMKRTWHRLFDRGVLRIA